MHSAGTGRTMEQERNLPLKIHGSGPGRGFWIAYAACFAVFTVAYFSVFVAVGVAPTLAARSAAAAIVPNAILGVAVIHWIGRLEPPSGRAGSLAFAAVQAGLLLSTTALATLAWLAEAWLRGAAFRTGWVTVAAWQTLVNLLIQIAVAALGHIWSAGARRSAAEALQAKAELASLRSQVSPRFFLNILSALPGLISRDPKRAESALERLGELLRFGLRVHQSEIDHVAFRDEWRLAQSCLSLEQLRLAPRLAVHLGAADDVMDLLIPPFALQPLIENAISRAVAPPREQGLVEIAARRADGRLLVEVEDNGPGLAEPPGSPSLLPELRLLRERLAALYGDDARLTFEPAARGGCRARLDLPVEPQEDEG